MYYIKILNTESCSNILHIVTSVETSFWLFPSHMLPAGFPNVKWVDEDEWMDANSLMLLWGLTGCFMVIHLADRLQQLTNQIFKGK